MARRCRVTHPGEVDTVLNALMAHSAVVYTKACLNHTDTVVNYLASYTHRITITNAQLLSLDEQGVTMRYKDYRDGNKNKTMHLDGGEFVRRYLLHILPKGLMRIRHYGFLANRGREKKLAQIRGVLGKSEEKAVQSEAALPINEVNYPCQVCRQGRLRVVEELLPRRTITTAPYH